MYHFKVLHEIHSCSCMFLTEFLAFNSAHSVIVELLSSETGTSLY